ncbi:WD repeat-containing WRAP73-like [Brachionus plicatilis]|uniref:WD repeat-containing WRAP73-like n=1 Tax=Brachionus plicatilis TaxID=10195 RepID=A0A3M7PUB2_BRAPC|nr:WD repeat-containing WRAP73-like [Brachionus plicatilis]
MNFSDLFKQSNQICEFSPNGKYLANVVQFRLIIRDLNSLEIINMYTCLDTINYIEWSRDSDFVLCCLNKRNIIQVFSLENPEWKCKIDEGSAGLAQANWSPDSRHILTTSDFHLRITVWSLMNKSVSYMKYPKNIPKCYQFTNDGKYMLLAERRDCKDYCSIFSCDSWQLLKHFEVETDNLEGICWSPNGNVFAVWESPLEYKVLIYNTDGLCMNTFQPYKWSLGVKTVCWSPNGQLLCIGSYDSKVRMLNYITFKLIMEFEHPTKINSRDLIIFKENDGSIRNKKDILSTSILNESNMINENEILSIYSTPSKYEVYNGNLQIAAIKPDLDKPNPKMGISSIQFSCDNRFMLTRNDSMPNILWIWDMKKFKLTNVLIQTVAVKCVSWDPRQNRLALCTNNNKIYMWSPQGCVSVETPCEATFSILSLKWNKDGQSLVLIGKDHFCVTYIQSETDVSKNGSDNPNSSSENLE